jgi:hypothetical protein
MVGPLAEVERIFKEFDEQTEGMELEDDEDYCLTIGEMKTLRVEINDLLKEVDDAYPEVGWSIAPQV